MDPEELTGILFDIQGFSVHDGPGCRTLIFLKGCPLSCRWCSNPEGKSRSPEPLYRRQKCTMDLLCLDACLHHAINVESDGLSIDRKKCYTCTTFDCMSACCSGAIQQGGYVISVSELYRVIQRDRQYWGSRGGITLTGGEPFFQPEFATAVLKQCHDAFVHTAAETCGDIPQSWLKPSLPYLDWLFFDLKQMDATLHKEWTGHSNHQILENAKWLAQSFHGRMVYRMTVIPGYNDQPEHSLKLARFISSTQRCEINLLPLHHLGREKYALTSRSYYTDSLTTPSLDSLLNMKKIIEKEGVTCYIGSETPF